MYPWNPPPNPPPMAYTTVAYSYHPENHPAVPIPHHTRVNNPNQYSEPITLSAGESRMRESTTSGLVSALERFTKNLSRNGRVSAHNNSDINEDNATHHGRHHSSISGTTTGFSSESSLSPYTDRRMVTNTGWVASPEHTSPRLQPGPDYAKMGNFNPVVPFTTLVGRFLRKIRDLPWVATDRVTTDYYPGQSGKRSRPRPVHRPRHTRSWYSDQPSSPSSQDPIKQQQSSPPIILHPVVVPFSPDHSIPISQNNISDPRYGYTSAEPHPTLFPNSTVYRAL
ncbi:hypothetical protein AMATHDRAFT_45373 [Amanita thiersii Skay4041]|uniref:Uncharacterized protein n=1 Tax=Amanita thiersii Skay4041 TaxID=703135 RepID=A0A2A9NYA2_9AGAR|nr:hypothetical protein AMATHDRAFT_45373 [Amanita thiersii Skay4041]